MHVVSNIYIDFVVVVQLVSSLPQSGRGKEEETRKLPLVAKVTLTVYQGDRSVVNLFYSVTGNK